MSLTYHVYKHIVLLISILHGKIQAYLFFKITSFRTGISCTFSILDHYPRYLKLHEFSLDYVYKLVESVI